jgi:hypothetical protein
MICVHKYIQYFNTQDLTQSAPWLYSGKPNKFKDAKMLTLMLVIGLCSDVGCDYIDLTTREAVTSDADCFQKAQAYNEYNRSIGADPRFACIEPHKYELLAKREI